jgi:hypothetical protein
MRSEIRRLRSDRGRAAPGLRGSLAATLGLVALLGLWSACSFDDTRLSRPWEFDQSGPPILDGGLDRAPYAPDLGTDGGGPADADAGEGAADGPSDATPDRPADVPVDSPGDAATDAPADSGGSDVGEGDAPTDGGARDGDRGDAADAGGDALPNQPPQITVPGNAPEVEAGVETPVPGVQVTDPDAGDAAIQITVSADQGRLSLGTIPSGLTFVTGDGTDDPVIAFQASQADANVALSSLRFFTDQDPGPSLIAVAADDLGHTGTGGSRTATASFSVTVLARRWDFNVQRGFAIIPSGQTEVALTAGVDYQAPAGPAFIRLVNTRLSGTGNTSGGTFPPSEWMAWVEDASDLAASVTIARYGTQVASATSDCRVAWEMVEYDGAAGGGNAWVVHGVGTTAAPAGSALVASSSFEGVADDADVVVLITGQAVQTDNADDAEPGFFLADWDSDRQAARFDRTDPEHDAVVSWAVVEMVGANWTVRRVAHTFGQAGVVESEKIDPPVDRDRAFLHVQHTAQDGVVDELGAEVWLAGDDAVSFELDASATGVDQVRSVAWVIANTEDGPDALVAGHYSGERTAGTGSMEDFWVHSVNAVPRLAQASVMGETARSTGTGNGLPRGSVSLSLSTPDGVQMVRSDTGQTQTYRFTVVQWPDE